MPGSNYLVYVALRPACMWMFSGRYCVTRTSVHEAIETTSFRSTYYRIEIRKSQVIDDVSLPHEDEAVFGRHLFCAICKIVRNEQH